MAEDAEKLSGIGGLLSGLGSQIAETKALSSQIQSMIGKTGKALDHAGGALRSIRNSELEAMTKWDNAQYLLGDEAQARVSDGRLYGGFEIPQGHTGGFSAERDSDVNRMKLVSGLTKRLLILGGDGADLAFTAGRGPRIPGTRGGAAGAAAAGAVPGVIGPAGGPAAGAAGGPGVGGAAAAAPGVIGALMWMLSPNDAGAAEGPLPGAGSDGAAGMTRDALQRAAAVAEATGSTGGRSNGRRVVRRLSIRTVTEPPIYSDQLPDDLIDQGVLLEGRAVPNGANGAAENYLTRGIFGQSEVTAPMTGVAVADSALEMQKDFIAAGGRDRDTSAGAATANGVLGSAGDGVLMLADGTIVQVGPSGMPIVGSARDISQIGIAPTQSEIDAFALLNSENTRLLSGQGIEPLGGSTNGGSEPSALAASAVNGQSVGWISDGDVATPNGTIVPNRERPDLSTEPTVFKPSVFGDASDYAGPTATLTAGENATGAENSAMPIPGFAGITLTGPSESSMFGKNNFMPGEMATLDIAAGVNPKESRPQDSLSAEPSVFTAQVFGGVSDYVGPRADSAPEGSGSNIARTEGALSGFEGVMLSTPSFTSVGTARPADSSMFGTGSALTGETASLGINAKETRQQDSLSAESSVFTAQVFGGTSDYAGSGAVFASGGNGRDGASTGSLSGFERVTLSTPSITSSNFVSAVETPANIAPVVTTSTSQSTSWFAAQDPFTSGLSSTTSAFGATAPESSAAVASNAGYVSLYGTPTAIETARPVDNAPSWGNSFIGQEKSSSKPIEIAASNFDTSRSAEVSTSKNVSTGFGNSSTTDAPASGFADSMQTFNAVDTSASVTSAASGRDAIPSAGWAFSSDSPEFVASRPIENNTTTNSWTVAEIEAAKQDRSAAETPVEKSVERAVELTVEKPLEVVEAQPTIAVEPAVVVVTPTVEQPAPVVSNAVESSTVESAAVEVAAVTAKATARKTEKPNRAARKSAAQVIIHAPEEEKKTAPTTDVSPDPNDAPSVGMAMDENRLTAERERLEQVAAGVVESLKKLEPGDPVAAAVSGTTEASIRSISYRAADGFDRPVVVIDGIRDDGHLIVANDDVVRELTAGGSGIVARPTAGAQLADPDTTVVISATEAGTLVGLEQSVALAERNGGERGAIERMVEQLDLTRADLAGALSREFARLDGALEFGALKAQNDYLKAQHERATFESDEAITRYLAQGSGLGKTDYVANLVERYGASLYGSEGSSSELSDQFVERLPGREVFSEQYVKPLEQSAFQYQQNRAAELQHWSLSESVNGESRLSFDTVTALGLGLQTTGATFEEQKREQQQLVVALSSRLITPDAQPQLAVQLDGENIEALRTAFQYTVGADAELKFEDYARVVQQLTRGNDTEAKRWLSGDQFIALVKEFGKPQGTT
jgi:hypothetical protein